jgi:hypothetical protein
MSNLKTQEPDRVRASTASSVNEEIDRTIRRSLQAHSGKSAQAITERIEELEREWDIERTLELNASTLAFVGLGLGMTVNKRWLIVPSVVLPFLFQHAVQGWCPPLPIPRRLGVRTREEIDCEKYALKALRGDFERSDDAPAALAASRA